MRLPFFGRRRRESRAWARQTIRTRHTFVAPPPQPRDLISVVGVGASETVNGVRLTLLSVERYAEGVVLLFRLVRRRGRFAFSYPMPSLAISMDPAGAVPYRVLMKGGGGGGDEEIEYRLTYAVVPAPPPGTHAIAIAVDEIAWERGAMNGRAEVVARDAGPWRYVVDLGAASGSGR